MQNNTPISIPEDITCAAFLVQDNFVTQLNQAAQQRHVPLGASIYELISSGIQEYKSFRSGKLYLQLYIEGAQCVARVSCYQKAHLFSILSDYDNTELQALALASSSLKDPLQKALSGAEQLAKLLSDSEDPQVRKSFGQINRGLYQMIRSIGNMSHASGSKSTHLEYRNVTALLDEVADNLRAKIPADTCSIQFTGLKMQIFTMVDSQALQRAIYNMVCNAIKFSPSPSTVTLKTTTKGERLYITVENACDTASAKIVNYFDRYLREPAIEDSRFGIGLGISVVRSIAAAHRGTLLITKKPKNIASVTLAIPIRSDSGSMLRSPHHLRMDRYGGFDPLLVELADILPDKLYEKI